MRTLSQLALGALLVAASMSITSPVYAQASMQSNDPSAPKTREQVRADLIEWRAAGFDPSNWIDYPHNALAAGRIVAERRAQQAAGAATQ
ncbi:DUF4148 domain-containing protein [Paraburkholderia antibiotica]|uniref:DUF4148 domain-containing protein n=1 Tax=Paraburkholderia antibiotica TaxID=2728839 RepID=A0A7X9ZY98_9BURK|nr:DUF4148 domain-containing protein [Paraburkholderia antibiotica]NML32902.1 DUF4148 domain-containing protein [Paraburkholderia antibiotica]